MLKRITNICGVGCYLNCKPPDIQFKQMTLIYGENRYGKTTLCDIFRSLAENNPAYIVNRTTVPGIEENSQVVGLNLLLPGNSSETPFLFKDGLWNINLENELNIAVFDTDFIHRNIFTGLTIQRENRENITHFILGESGVENAKEISDKKSEMRKLNASLSEMETEVFNEVDDLQSFVQLSVTDTADILDKSITELLVKIKTVQDLLQNVEKARTRTEPVLCNEPPDVTAIISSANDSLAKTYQQAHADAELVFKEHIEKHTLKQNRAKVWIQEGVALIKNSICPFCGQNISESAEGLIKAYQDIFDKAFEDYIHEVKTTLQEVTDKIDGINISILTIQIEQNRSACLQYPELNNKEVAQEAINSINEIAVKLIGMIESWSGAHDKLKNNLSEAIKSKYENIHADAGPLETGSADILMQAIIKEVGSYNKRIETVCSLITEFKESLDPDKINFKIVEMQDMLKTLRQKRKRIELDPSCEKYLDLYKKKTDLAKDIPQLQSALEQEQAAFLDAYFDEVNEIFKALGSSQFAVMLEGSRRGDMPTVQLRLTFNGVAVTQDMIGSYLSESDKRALAFAVFWARLKTLDEEELKRTIVVLDDPVTSFDSGRIDRAIRLIARMLPQLRQVIVLSHYKTYLEVFLNRTYNQQNDYLLAKLYQDISGTKMCIACPADFTETEHQRAFKRIFEFIERKHTDDISKDLRIFLEQETIFRYYKSIFQHKLQHLAYGELLDELVSLGVMNDSLKSDIDDLRCTLNPDHHNWADRSHEEKVSLAEDVMELFDN